MKNISTIRLLVKKTEINTKNEFSIFIENEIGEVLFFKDFEAEIKIQNIKNLKIQQKEKFIYNIFKKKDINLEKVKKILFEDKEFMKKIKTFYNKVDFELYLNK